jgi:hypothetical protein
MKDYAWNILKAFLTRKQVHPLCGLADGTGIQEVFDSAASVVSENLRIECTVELGSVNTGRLQRRLQNQLRRNYYKSCGSETCKERNKTSYIKSATLP